MTGQRVQIAAALTLLALGGLTGYAFSAQSQDNASSAQKPAPVEVRTQVIKRTIRVHRKPKKPKKSAAAAAPAAPPPAPVSQPVSSSGPAPQSKGPVTRTSGGGGGGGGEGDDGGEHEGGGDD